MYPTVGIAGPGEPDESQAAIERFLKASRQPILLEPGEEHFPLTPGSYSLYRDGVRLILQVWDERRNLVRRVTGYKAEQPGRLELVVEKFPQAVRQSAADRLGAPGGGQRGDTGEDACRSASNSAACCRDSSRSGGSPN